MFSIKYHRVTPTHYRFFCLSCGQSVGIEEREFLQYAQQTGDCYCDLCQGDNDYVHELFCPRDYNDLVMFELAFPNNPDQRNVIVYSTVKALRAISMSRDSWQEAMGKALLGENGEFVCLSSCP